MVKSSNGDENYMVLVTRRDETTFLDIVTIPEGADLSIFAWVKYPHALRIDYQNVDLVNPMTVSK